VRTIAIVLTGAGLFAVAGPATGAGSAIRVSPTAAPAGSLVRVSGSADGGCAPGDGVTLISRAFPHTSDFAGLPAVYALPAADGRFSVRVRIPAVRSPGAYAITGRCGGGNLGVTARLRVLARPGPKGGLAERDVVLRPSGARLHLVLTTRVLDRRRDGRLALYLSSRGWSPAARSSCAGSTSPTGSSSPRACSRCASSTPTTRPTSPSAGS